MDEDERRRIAAQVKDARTTRHGWTKAEAARRAQVSTITYNRVEDGLPVRDDKLAAVLAAVSVRRAPGVTGAPSSDLAALLADDPTLSAASRAHIVNQYRLLQQLSALEVQPPDGPPQAPVPSSETPAKGSFGSVQDTPTQKQRRGKSA